MRNKLEENQKVFAENQKRLRYWSEKLGKLGIQRVRYVWQSLLDSRDG